MGPEAEPQSCSALRLQEPKDLSLLCAPGSSPKLYKVKLADLHAAKSAAARPPIVCKSPPRPVTDPSALSSFQTDLRQSARTWTASSELLKCLDPQAAQHLSYLPQGVMAKDLETSVRAEGFPALTVFSLAASPKELPRWGGSPSGFDGLPQQVSTQSAPKLLPSAPATQPFGGCHDCSQEVEGSSKTSRRGIWAPRPPEGPLAPRH